MRVVRVCMCTVWVPAVCGSQKKALDSTGTWVTDGCEPLWVLGTECKYSTGAARAPNCWAISPSPGCIVFGMGILHCVSCREGWIFKGFYLFICMQPPILEDLRQVKITFKFFSRSHYYKTGRLFIRAAPLQICPSIPVGTVYRRPQPSDPGCPGDAQWLGILFA